MIPLVYQFCLVYNIFMDKLKKALKFELSEKWLLLAFIACLVSGGIGWKDEPCQRMDRAK
jgi:hypothetical protein